LCLRSNSDASPILQQNLIFSLPFVQFKDLLPIFDDFNQQDIENFFQNLNRTNAPHNHVDG
jgi:hypothetical protein